ncbi:hypothetical protein C0995_008713 [Termitomyces sp. Mi166|nr:hypothetical protein C0995_008713 [Termitomyces sp. Mi166\
MPDFSVYVAVDNKTNEHFLKGWAHAKDGEWKGFSDVIKPKNYHVFRLKDPLGMKGAEGTFGFQICSSGGIIHGAFATYQEDPYSGDNKISYTPPPPAVYHMSYHTKVSDKEWKWNTVDPDGHPVYVVYTIEYQRKQHFKWQLIEIAAHSDHPVRNSRQDLITMRHTLWNHKNPSIYPDGSRGSFQPNVFGYEFGSKVAAKSILNVTIKAVDRELVGAQVVLFGVSNGTRVIESDPFFFKDMSNVKVDAHVIHPTSSGNPFSFNADVDWRMELNLTKEPVTRDGTGVTRLELYWIAITLHPAFRAFIPITFLRGVVPPTAEVTAPATNSEYYQNMTKRVFNDYHKRFDTVSGATHLVMRVRGTDHRFCSWLTGASMSLLNYNGGSFNERLYLLEDPTGEGPVGSLLPLVNCMDQAAMLELSCSLRGGSSLVSWLYQAPFGYINTTYLVGVTESGDLVGVNNPFFGTDISHAEVRDINDLSRSPFKVYVYVGHSSKFNRESDDGIYDGCSGPHLGTETIKKYITNAIDTQTKLYGERPWECRAPGTVANVTQGNGVVSINDQRLFSQSCTLPLLTEPLSRLVDTAVANTGSPLAHVGWACLSTWLKATLGDEWKILYEQVTVGAAEAQALWLIFDVLNNTRIRVHINVVSVIDQDGYLDMNGSAAVVKEHISGILMSTTRQDIWTSGNLSGFEGVSLRYADHVAAGRIVLVAGNIVMDISGMTSYEALLPYALKLFDRTVRLGPLDRLPPVAPVLQRQAIRMGTDTSDTTTTLGEPENETEIITVTGIGTRFSLVFSVSCKIATANAGCEEHGVLFDRHIVEELDNNQGCTVEFLFVAREVGRHRVRVCVADLETMIGATSDLEVEVVEASEKVHSESGELGATSDLEVEVVEASEKVHSESGELGTNTTLDE